MRFVVVAQRGEVEREVEKWRGVLCFIARV